MPVGTPGRRAGSGIALRQVKRNLETKTSRSLSASLNLTSMVDFMSVIVIFLLMNFSASGDAMFTQPDIRLPSASLGEEVERVPVVTVSANTITFEGKPVADSPQVLASEGDSGLEGLDHELQAEKEAFTAVRKGEEFDGKIIIASDEHVPYKLVRRVFNVAAKAGYVRVNYVVRLDTREEK